MLFDEKIKKNITDELYWDARIDASGIKVLVEGGKVVLTGEIPNYGVLGFIMEDLRKIPGIVSIDNQLSVDIPKYPDQSNGNDEEVADYLRGLLKWDANVDQEKITIDIDDGKVVLEGSVTDFWKKEYANNLVSNTKGIKEVENLISIVPTDGILDKNIATRIRAAMERNLYVDPTEITLVVNGGKVTMSGFVPDLSAFKAAHESALFTKGVVEINNHLTIHEEEGGSVEG